MQRQQAETLKLQREILEQQRQQQKVLLPFLAEQEGFKAETDEFGNITKISKTDTVIDRKRKELEEGLVERSLRALKGELPVDPALERSLEVNERTLREKLRAQLGPGFETSSAGIESLGDFSRNAEILRFGARTETLTLAEQLALTREQQNLFKKQSAQDVLTNQAQGVPLTLAGGFGQNARGFGAAQQPFIEQRKMQLQASIANAQTSAGRLNAGIGAIGSFVGLFSDSRIKENLVQIGMHSRLNVPIYIFNYIGNLADRYIGVLAEDIMGVRPDAVYTRGGYAMVDYGAL